MPAAPWFPSDEAEAVSARAVFIEWLRATGRRLHADPADIQAWRKADPTAFRAAFATFAGIDPTAPPRDALRRPAPEEYLAFLDTTRIEDFVDAIAAHLLDANTRPDDQLTWTGSPALWPLAALAIGADVQFKPRPSAPDAG
jgi:hypothetical protein